MSEISALVVRCLECDGMVLLMDGPGPYLICSMHTRYTTGHPDGTVHGMACPVCIKGCPGSGTKRWLPLPEGFLLKFFMV